MRNNVYIRLIKRLSDFKLYFIFATITIILIAIFDASFPLIYAYAIDNIITAKDYDKVTPFIIFFAVFALSFTVIVYASMRLLGSLEVKFSQKLRNELFEKIQRLHISYFSKNDDGWIISRITGDVTKLADVMSWQFIDVIYFLFSFSFILILIFSRSLKIGIITLILYPLLVFIIYLVRNKVLKYYRLTRSQNSIVTSKFNELINGIQTIKTMNIESKSYNEFEEENYKMYRYSRRALLYSALFSPITIFIGYIIFSTNLFVSSNDYFLGILTIGGLSAIMNYTLILIESTNELTAILAEFQNAQANAERIFSLLDEPIEIVDSEEVIKKYGDIFSSDNKSNIRGDVVFENIDFSYPDSKKLFNDFNLKVKAGQSVAFVGETGSGKTTLINLLTRLYEPQSGTIYIDGVDIQKRSINYLHHNIGQVLQNPKLFSGTIKENIRYNSNVSDKQINDVIDLLGFRDVVDSMDNGINSLVGESGNRLSVGEKQLISFARAIVNDPQIIIMDEATSSIDSDSEQLITYATDKLLKNRTSFIIAHRLSTIRNSDLIVVLKYGKIIEVGNHKQLMSNKNYYYDLNKS